MYEKGEMVIFDYADDQPRIIWGLHFEIGDAIAVLLNRPVKQGDLLREMGAGGPWAWGGFRTEWIESIADRVEWLYDSSVLYTNAEATPLAAVHEETHSFRNGQQAGVQA